MGYFFISTTGCLKSKNTSPPGPSIIHIHISEYTPVASHFFLNTVNPHEAGTLISVDFEIHGTVQDVDFPRHTKEQADMLGLRGWCKNTAEGTVLGHVQGPSEKIEAMMMWLRTLGSPSSVIEKAEFRNNKIITEYTFEDFSIRRD